MAHQKPKQTPKRPSAADDLTRNLTSDSWVKVLGAEGQSEQYVYTFSKDGHYTSKLITDFNTQPLMGQWRLTRGKDGKTHLILTNAQQTYYWLQQDSIIRYDKTQDVMLISGEKYVGVQQPRRKKADAKAE